MTNFKLGSRHPEDAAWRTDAGESRGSDFDLKVTLEDTEVHEASYAEFLNLLKQSGRSGG